MREAGALARKTAQGAFKHWTKGEDRSPVSEADIAVNDLLHQRLTALAPGAGWLSEETAEIPSSTALMWIVDPIDGTRAFISGRADWSISVALVEEGRPLVAALYAPVSEEIFLAARGTGATLNGTPINANEGDGLRGAKIAGPKRYLDRFSSLAEGTLAQPKVHSLALRLARVAQGNLDAAFSSRGQPRLGPCSSRPFGARSRRCADRFHRKAAEIQRFAGRSRRAHRSRAGPP